MPTPRHLPRQHMQFRLDHIAIGVRSIAACAPAVEATLGGVRGAGGPSPGFDWAQWAFSNDARLELIEPSGSAGFLHRFLDRQGVGVHHVTFKVADLEAAAARARSAGYDVVGYDDSLPGWKECFLHPKQAQGIVVQMAESHADPAEKHAQANSGVALHALRLRAREASAVLRQWRDLLGGVPEDGLPDGTFCFRWAASPIAIRVQLEPASEAGPVAIELSGRVRGASASITGNEFSTLFGTPFEVT